MKRYVITSAQYDSEVNEIFFKNLLFYCKERDAKLIIVPIKYSRCKHKQGKMDSLIKKYVITANVMLNENIGINVIPINPSLQNPLSSLERFAKSSLIFASPKMALKVIPTSNCKLPKVLMTAGCVTCPEYKNTKTGMIAIQDHKFGAIVVETEGSLYHFRQLEANNNFEINDLGKRYGLNKVKNSKIEALILGDWHTNSTCKKVREVTLNDMIPLFNPKYLIFHDIADNYSITHHHNNQNIVKVIKVKENKSNLRKELDSIIDELKHIRSKTQAKFIIVNSNHDQFLNRYIQENRFVNDPENYEISLELALAMIKEKKDPLVYYLEKYGHIQNMVILKEDDDFKIKGIQLSNHGHLGANGARGSMMTQEKSVIKSVVGHSHSPEILRGIWRVGTSTELKLEYNLGFSSWVNSHIVLYEDGTRQIINIIDGKWQF